jgi:hypothetical protein
MARLEHSTQSATLRYQGQVSGRDVEIAEASSVLANAKGGRKRVENKIERIAPERNLCVLPDMTEPESNRN